MSKILIVDFCGHVVPEYAPLKPFSIADLRGEAAASITSWANVPTDDIIICDATILDFLRSKPRPVGAPWVVLSYSPSVKGYKPMPPSEAWADIKWDYIITDSIKADRGLWGPRGERWWLWILSQIYLTPPRLR